MTPSRHPRLITSGRIGGMAAILSLIVVVGWGWITIARRASGAGGADAYAYVQMGLDVAATGSTLHAVPIIETISLDGTEPDYFVRGFFPTGYSPTAPFASLGKSIFPPGTALLLAAAVRIGGESALFLVPPLIGILVLLLTIFLAHLVLGGQPTALGWVTGAIAVTVFALSRLHNTLSLVPRSDPPSELFVLAAACLCLSLGPSSRLAWFFLTGLTIGIAYLMRHPALLFLLPCLGWTLTRRGWSARGLIAAVVLLAGFAAVCLPELAYHRAVYGGVLVAENPSSLVLDWDEAGARALLMLRRLARGEEFGSLLLLVPVGLYFLYKRGRRSQACFLSAWIGVFILFHLPLELTSRFDNPSRFLLPAFPAIACLVGLAVAALPTQAGPPPKARTFMVLLAVLVFGYQKGTNLPPWLDYTPRSYGHLTERSRAAYQSFDELLPAEAIVVSDSQQSGAIQLYGRRPTVQPSFWSEQQFERFVNEARDRGWPLYAVARGMPESVRRYRLSRVRGLKGRLLLLE